MFYSESSAFVDDPYSEDEPAGYGVDGIAGCEGIYETCCECADDIVVFEKGREDVEGEEQGEACAAYD